MDRTEEIDRELERLSELPLGTARTVAVERIVARLELEGPAELLARGYTNLVRSYVWGGEVEKSFVPFTKLLRHFDAHPELFSDEDREQMFWSFRWMVSRCMDFPQVPFEQIEETLADMERRYALAGLAMDAVRLDQFRWAWLQGLPETERLYWEWVHTPREPEDTCTLCDAAGEAHYLADTGRVAEAIDRLARAENNPSCDPEPAGIYLQLAEYHLTLADPATAVRAYRRSARLLPRSTVSADTRGRIALFFARGGHPERALRRIESDQELLLECDTPAERMYFLNSIAAAARLVALVDPELPVYLNVLPLRTAAELAAWAREEALALATAFDERNRGTQLTSDLAKLLALEPAPEPLDLSVLNSPADASDTAPRAAEQGPGGRTDASSGTDADPGIDTEPEADVQLEPSELVKIADGLVRRGALLEAAPRYLAAASALFAAGELVDAGLAEANAARCAHELEDFEGADAAYRHAIGVLRAAGGPVVVTSGVVRSWVRVALETGGAADALDALMSVRAEILTRLEDEENPKAARTLRTELAESLDTHARALASRRQPDEAVRLAVEAAEIFASLARVADAAEAFWLAGRTLADDGRDEAAVEHLESAVEGFTLARRSAPRAKAATHLLEALRRLGRDSEADAVASQLAKH